MGQEELFAGKVSGTEKKKLEEHCATKYSRLTGNRLVMSVGIKRAP